jgi:catechol 1,2-dioxygenase
MTQISPHVSTPSELTDAVLAVMQATPDPRLREIMTSLVSHLHSFVAQVKLTEDEFRRGTALIAQLGQLSNAQHNEVVLMAGSLGVSSLVCLQNNGVDTNQNLLGPFWRMHSPPTANGDSILRGPTPGTPMWMLGTVVDTQGKAIANALVDIWHCAPTGFYEQQEQGRAQGQVDMNLRGQFTTDSNGQFSFWSVKPIGYPIPADGVVGKLLQAQGRHPMRPAHVHALIFKEGFKTMISQVYDSSDPNIDSDVQFGVTRTLSAPFTLQAASVPKPTGQRPNEGEWYRFDYTFTLHPGIARLPAAPIK